MLIPNKLTASIHAQTCIGWVLRLYCVWSPQLSISLCSPADASGWWRGRFCGKEGLFPGNYVEKIWLLPVLWPNKLCIQQTWLSTVKQWWIACEPNGNIWFTSVSTGSSCWHQFFVLFAQQYQYKERNMLKSYPKQKTVPFLFFICVILSAITDLTGPYSSFTEEDFDAKLWGANAKEDAMILCTYKIALWYQM